MKILQIIHTAYRATIEEQDDTVVWLTHAMTGAGGDFDVLLTGNAVSYTARGQDADGLAFGDWQQTQPPKIARDVAGLIEKGVGVYFLREDAEAIGLGPSEQIDRVHAISRDELARLISDYDAAWRW